MTTRVAFVTGAAQGIGESIALRLAEDGLDVAILDVRGKEEQMQDVVKRIEGFGRRAHWIVGDVSSETSVKDAVESVVQALGCLDVMVANAGFALRDGRNIIESKLTPSTEDWDAIFAVHARGTMLSYKYAALQMIKQGGGGRLIGACSIAGKQGLIHLGAYSAAKFAIRGLTHVMSKELKEHNITVNAYAPGLIKTAMTAHPDDDKYGGPGSVIKNAIGLPSDTKLIEPSVIADLVSYLARPEASFITGQIVSVDGGLNYD
ncbi:NAD-P-binding protein [Irpex rosettiformis]|uniref:NAD-P-binding protein n=1 Tax=Irpex rosettiformis TaxID=378272 RepID=A0ACB8U3U4_9APHY|nr:NAD-P-binding protein [Irpex rosettiformis]